MPKTRSAVLASLFVLFGAPLAHAASPVETAISSWVQSLDASPNWAAHYRALTYQPASDTATLAGLSITSEDGSAKLDFETITIAGYSQANDGSFAVKNVKLDGATLETGFVKVALSDASLTDFGMPNLAAVTYDKARPFTSMVKAYAQALKGHIGHASVASIAVIEQIQGATSRITYAGVTVDGFANGKIAALKAGPLKLESPSPNGLVSISVGSVESADTDLAALVRVYDPDAYVGGIGDRIWRRVVGHAAYHDIRMALPGADLSIGSITADDMKLRQPRDSFADFLDTMIAEPEKVATGAIDVRLQAARAGISMMSAFGISRFSIENINVKANDTDHVHIADIRVSDLSSDGLGEFAIDGVDGSVAQQGTLKLGRFAFGGMTFPSMDAISAGIEAGVDGNPPDPKTLIPHLGFVEASGIDVAMADTPRILLKRFRLDLGNYVGPVPTLISSETSGLSVPTDMMTDDRAREMLKKLGYEQIEADYGLKLGWHEANGMVTIDDFHFKIKDMGSMTASLALAGLDRSAIEQVYALGDAISGMSFTGAKATFTDDSITMRSLALQAEKMNVSPDKFRQQFAGALPFMLSFLRNPDFQKQIVPVLQTFLGAPGTITMVAQPPAPVPLATIEKTGRSAPQNLPTLLGVTLSGKPGAPPPANFALPKVEAPPAPPPPPPPNVQGANPRDSLKLRPTQSPN